MVASYGHYTNHRDAEVQEATEKAALIECLSSEGNNQDACNEYGQYDESQFRTEFWRDAFENHQSEYAQLFFQGLVLVALVNVLAKRESENTKDDVREVLDERGIGT